MSLWISDGVAGGYIPQFLAVATGAGVVVVVVVVVVVLYYFILWVFLCLWSFMENGLYGIKTAEAQKTYPYWTACLPHCVVSLACLL
jgi:hypothetical protein